MNALLLFGILAFVGACCYAAILNDWRQRISDAVVSEEARPSALADPPLVSLVIPARNAADTVAPLLQDLYAQQYPAQRLEVLVVDDASTDGTRSVVEGMQRTWPALSIFPNEGEGKKAAITTGVQWAKGELILLTDADARCGPMRVACVVEQWSRTKADLLLAPVHTAGEGWLGRLQENEQVALSAVAAGTALGGAPLLANGANMAFTTHAFEEVGGYAGDRYASGDDVFLLERMKRGEKRISYVLQRDAVVTVEAEATFKGFCQQRLRWAGKMRGVRGAGKWLAAVAMMMPWLLLAFTLAVDQTKAANHGLFRVVLLVGCAWMLWFVPQISLARRYMTFLGSTRSHLSIGPSALCFALYAPLFAIASVVVRPEWRGRKI
jgi:cellulose synthase/poly-beta-1,6-N-acetylglucosamine synthase-like glycosyltransferase